jgi:hypothetical protein
VKEDGLAEEERRGTRNEEGDTFEVVDQTGCSNREATGKSPSPGA